MKALAVTGIVLAMTAIGLTGAWRGSASTQRFEVQARGYEVLDHQTGLIWQRCPLGMGTVWPSASPNEGCIGEADRLRWDRTVKQAKQKELSSGKAWRLPTVHELNSIFDPEQPDFAMNPKVFPFYAKRTNADGTKNHDSQYFWSANTYNDDPKIKVAWAVDFAGGLITQQEFWHPNFIRLVRDGCNQGAC